MVGWRAFVAFVAMLLVVAGPGSAQAERQWTEPAFTSLVHQWSVLPLGSDWHAESEGECPNQPWSTGAPRALSGWFNDEGQQECYASKLTFDWPSNVSKIQVNLTHALYFLSSGLGPGVDPQVVSGGAELQLQVRSERSTHLFPVASYGAKAVPATPVQVEIPHRGEYDRVDLVLLLVEDEPGYRWNYGDPYARVDVGNLRIILPEVEHERPDAIAVRGVLDDPGAEHHGYGVVRLPVAGFAEAVVTDHTRWLDLRWETAGGFVPLVEGAAMGGNITMLGRNHVGLTILPGQDPATTLTYIDAAAAPPFVPPEPDPPVLMPSYLGLDPAHEAYLPLLVPLLPLVGAIVAVGRFAYLATDRHRRLLAGLAGLTLGAIAGQLLSTAGALASSPAELGAWPRAPLSTWVVVLSAVTLVSLGVMTYTHRRLPELRQHAATERVQQAAMADRASELETFLQGVGHDLKTPLVALDWLTQDLEAELHDVPRDAVRETMQRIRKSVGGMEALTKDLQEIVRLDNESLGEGPSDLREIADEVSALVEEERRRRAANLVLDRVTLPVIALDRAPARRILQNLVSNAIKYGCHDGGTVYVRCRPAEGGLRIEVEDEGPGVPEDEREAVFRLLRRGSTTADSAGTGVGLALVRRTAERAGGKAWVEDGAEWGARFVVWLPGRLVIQRDVRRGG